MGNSIPHGHDKRPCGTLARWCESHENCPKHAECVRSYDPECPHVRVLKIRFGERQEWGLTEAELLEAFSR